MRKNNLSLWLSLGALGLALCLMPACGDDDEDPAPPANNANNTNNDTNNPTNNGTNNPTNNGTNNPTNNGTNNPTNNGTNNTPDPVAQCVEVCGTLSACTELVTACGAELTAGLKTNCEAACEVEANRQQILAVGALDCATATPLALSGFDVAQACSPACADYCTALDTNCTGDNAIFGSNAECRLACNTYETLGTEGDTSGDSLACRTYHAGDPAAADPATHCPHADVDGGGVCVDVEPQTLCDQYCDLALANCTGGNLLYATEAECQAACTNFQMDGTDGDTSGDSVQCRIYHVGAPAAADPAIHCAHAAPNGGGICVDPEATLCERFCAVAEENCTDTNRVYADTATCVAACASWDDGNLGDDTGNTVHCRLTYANAAATSPNNKIAECLGASEAGGGVCIDANARQQIDRMGRPGINTALVSSGNKDAFNAVKPGDGAIFTPEMLVFLQAYDDLDGDGDNGLLGDTPANRMALAGLLADDVLQINIDIADCTGGYLALELGIAANCGGRTLAEDVMDKTLQSLVGLPAVTDAVGADDIGFQNNFPYVNPVAN